MIFSAASLALASKLLKLKNSCLPLFILFLYCTCIIFCSDEESLSMKDAPNAGAAATAASKTLTAPETAKDSAPAGTGKESAVPKKKAKKSNADKGVVITSDNPSGPPMDDVSFVMILCALFSAAIFSRVHRYS